uniref:Uncharacterized protein n=1 Tax=Meloidogyne enterolobii TaxID=390850 RepID=A0A6V7VUN7_MELEN|nr:unnamed protein product [Meloidogyne enterolobii]
MHFINILLPGFFSLLCYTKIIHGQFNQDFIFQCICIIITINTFIIELFIIMYVNFKYLG